MQQKFSLAAIDAGALLQAIYLFNELGRTRFLRRYRYSRASKYYLLHQQRFYDTKALVACGYEIATGRPIPAGKLHGGPQSTNLITRIARGHPSFERSEVFEDTLGELRHLAGEFDSLPSPLPEVGKLGFSRWIRFSEIKKLHTGSLPGVYLVAESSQVPVRMAVLDPRIIYVGETVSQDLSKRLSQMRRALNGKSAHSGGTTLRAKGYRNRDLWLSIRSFALRYGIKDAEADPVRSLEIRFLERVLLLEYARRNGRYPAGNRK